MKVAWVQSQGGLGDSGLKAWWVPAGFVKGSGRTQGSLKLSLPNLQKIASTAVRTSVQVW